MLEGRKGVHMWMILMTTTRTGSKMKRITIHRMVRAGSGHGEKGMVEVSEEI
jgi:hypothetical protein